MSCQSSTLLLTLVTWDRFVSVTRPLQTRATNKSRYILWITNFFYVFRSIFLFICFISNRATIRLVLLWTSSIAFAAVPFSNTKYFGSHFYGNNGVCLSLHIHDPYAEVIFIFFFFFIKTKFNLNLCFIKFRVGSTQQLYSSV